jgi:TPR repeat protein
MTCVNCGKIAVNSDYCTLCYHCGEVGCLDCGVEVVRNCISCGNHNKKISDKSRVLKLIELIEKNPYHKNKKIFYVVIGNYYISVKDFVEAFKWNLKAANRGDSSSQYYLAIVYFKGYYEVGHVDYKKALYWFTLAAENGIKEAFKFLGRMYRDGLGVTEDPYKSTVMFAIGAMKKNKECEEEFFKSFKNNLYGFITKPKLFNKKK